MEHHCSCSTTNTVKKCTHAKYLDLRCARFSRSDYAPPPVDEHGRYPWEVAAAAAAASAHGSSNSAGDASSAATSSTSALGYGADPNAFDPSAYGYAQPARQGGRRLECTICKRSGHDYKSCPNKKQKGESDTVYISNLPTNVTEKDLLAHFGSIGIVAIDKKTKGPKVKIYLDSAGKPKGDALLSYEDAATAPAAVDWFHDQDYKGNKLSVVMAYGGGQSASIDAGAPSSLSSSSYGAPRGGAGGYSSGYGTRSRRGGICGFGFCFPALITHAYLF